ncbi:hypothetical protein ABZP36_027982 [Zizania latifolia]
MNSTLVDAAFFRSLTSKPQLRPQQRHQLLIVSKRGARAGKHGLELKPVQATQRPNSTGGLNNTNRGEATLRGVVQEFYSSLNAKDSKRLAKLLASDCVIEDNVYYKPLDIKSSRIYFTRLMDAMGKNVKFAIDEVSQGELQPTVAVMWHLEWKGKIIPFTNGCSFYICSGKEASPPVIRRVHIFQESPVKPCKFALEILNIVTNLFDTFPKIAEGFLKNPGAAIQPFLRLYKYYVKPFVVPFLAYYTHLWTLLSKGLAMVFSILCRIIKMVV